MELIRTEEMNGASVTQSACEVLSAGGVIVYPTDTVYGLGADATNERAVQTVRSIKGREDTKPILAMVADSAMLEEYAHVTPLARALVARFLPGPLSLVLMPKDTRLSAIAGGDGGVGFRISAHPFCHALATAYGIPITSTSMNRSGFPQPHTLAGMLAQVGSSAQYIDTVYDWGDVAVSAPSTVVDARGDIGMILREGAISRATLCEVVPLL